MAEETKQELLLPPWEDDLPLSPGPGQPERLQPSPPSTPKRIGEVSSHGRFEGEPTTIEDILGEDVTILAYQSRQSQFEGRDTYLAIQIQHNGIKKVISTGSGPIIDTFEGIKPEDLPLIAKFSKGKSKAGRRYYTIV